VTLHPRSEFPIPLDGEVSDNAEIIIKLRETVGDLFADKLMSDSAWVKGLLGIGVQNGDI
jgi:transcription initiation factor TFIID subunit 6